jgi:DNA-binding NarL/FixJ family response regulator
MGPSPDEEVAFTAREREVLELLARGMTNDEIAAALFLSPNTVPGYRKALFAKLGVHSKIEAVVQAAARGLVELPGAEPDPGADGHGGAGSDG